MTIIYLSVTQVCQGQIGINTTHPNSMAALDIRGNEKQGILIPIVNRSGREAMQTQPLKKGMLVCDTTDYSLYMYTNTGWKNLSPFTWIKEQYSDSNIYISNTMLEGANVGIGTDFPLAKLHVMGTTRFDKDQLIYGNTSVNGNVLAKNNLHTTQNTLVNKKITINQTCHIYNNCIINGTISGNGSLITSVNADSIDSCSSQYFIKKSFTDSSFKELTSKKLSSQNKYFANTTSTLGSYTPCPNDLSPYCTYADSIKLMHGYGIVNQIKNIVFADITLKIKVNFTNYEPIFTLNIPPSSVKTYFMAHYNSQEQNDISVLCWIENNKIHCKGEFIMYNSSFFNTLRFQFFYWSNNTN
jgi:hypothetical protein